MDKRTPVIFLTGATGFLGGAVVAHLANQVARCRLVLLVRGKNETICLDRVRTSVARFVDVPRVDALLQEAIIIRGDVTERAWHDDVRLNAVTHVLHLAANTSFGIDQEICRTNVGGALSVAESMRGRPHLVRYLHVSTAMVCGDKPPQVVHEDDYPRDGVGYPVPYPSTKAEAEVLLAQYRGELPLVVARPSIVVGHSRLGCSPSGAIFWCFRAVHALKRVTWDMETRMDVLPVDHVAGSLVALLLKPSLSHSCYHISAGDTCSVTWDEIRKSFEGVFQEPNDGPYQKVDFGNITQRHIAERVGSGPAKRMRRAMELYYRFGGLDVVFDNARMLAEGIPTPPKFTQYLGRCVQTSLHQTIYAQMSVDG